MAIREALSSDGTWNHDVSGHLRFEPEYPAGEKIAHVAVLGDPAMHPVPLSGFQIKRDGVWRAQ